MHPPLLASWRRPARLLSGLLVVLVLAAIGLLGLGVPPTAAADPPVVVVSVAGAPDLTRTYSLDDLAGLVDVEGSPYVLRDESGETSAPVGDRWVSLRALVRGLGDAGPDPDAVTFTEVSGPDGVSHPLPAGALGAGAEAGFAGDLVPAVGLAADRPALSYVRPLRGEQDANLSADANRSGYLLLDGGTLSIVVHTGGRLLDVDADASLGDRGAATFSATVAGDAPPGLAVTWDFGDGSQAVTGTRVRHTYRSAGTYRVLAQARGDDGSWGRSAPLSVEIDTVATPSPTSSPTPSPTKSPTATPTSKPTATVSPSATRGPSATAEPTQGGQPVPGVTLSPGGPGAIDGPDTATEIDPPAVPAVPGASLTPSAVTTYVTGLVLTGGEPTAVPAPTTTADPVADRGSAPLDLPWWAPDVALLLGLLGLGALRESSHLARLPRRATPTAPTDPSRPTDQS